MKNNGQLQSILVEPWSNAGVASWGENAEILWIKFKLVVVCKMIPAATIDEALELAASKLGLACDVLIVPHAMLTLPILRAEA